jgi:hypothetical protein
MSLMKFKDRFIIEDNSIKMFRGYYRDKPCFETCIEGNEELIKKIYSLLEMVYNSGEHQGRLFVRNNIKTALGIDL